MEYLRNIYARGMWKMWMLYDCFINCEYFFNVLVTRDTCRIFLKNFGMSYLHEPNYRCHCMFLCVFVCALKSLKFLFFNALNGLRQCGTVLYYSDLWINISKLIISIWFISGLNFANWIEMLHVVLGWG